MWGGEEGEGGEGRGEGERGGRGGRGEGEGGGGERRGLTSNKTSQTVPNHHSFLWMGKKVIKWTQYLQSKNMYKDNLHLILSVST